MRLQVTDDDGAPAIASRQVVVAAAPPPAANLLANPSFETNLAGWSGYQATLVREAQAGAPAGGYVAKVTRSSGTSFTIDDGARAVPSLVAGTTYTAEVWVKAASASSVGKPIQIKLRERTAAGTVVADVGSANVALTNSWQKLTLVAHRGHRRRQPGPARQPRQRGDRQRLLRRRGPAAHGGLSRLTTGRRPGAGTMGETTFAAPCRYRPPPFDAWVKATPQGGTTCGS